ncbi:hypothetical protein BGZ94_003254, partial [Podila epigama]
MPVTYTKVEKVTDAAAVKASYKPTHPGLFEVMYAEGDYNSKLVASKPFAKGEIICKVEGITPGPKRYTSVQVGKDKHIELNSDCNTTNRLDVFIGYSRMDNGLQRQMASDRFTNIDVHLLERLSDNKW